ncbi:NUDIX hydrolase [Natronomonas marina]|jgi:8-oxo-dGTP pyrophosphatase MutT (NUDIX family)|uniref:NUDIX hydrolase n=1 Tax=Natronomonas marina TaxID=2961939 RepID=UPI0020C992D8|nr:NUDIX domain-containing protein [Natronomonas marina]
METTRHFVATCYVVCDGATLLHEHEKLDMWLPPGGHVDRDELPHQTALRETHEETGLRPDLVADAGPYDTAQATSLPRPAALLLEDIDTHEDGRVAHQHVDFVYFAECDGRTVDPVGRDEADADAWTWFEPADLDARADDLAVDVRDLGKRAIETVA